MLLFLFVYSFHWFIFQYSIKFELVIFGLNSIIYPFWEILKIQEFANFISVWNTISHRLLAIFFNYLNSFPFAFILTWLNNFFLPVFRSIPFRKLDGCSSFNVKCSKIDSGKDIIWKCYLLCTFSLAIEEMNDLRFSKIYSQNYQIQINLLWFLLSLAVNWLQKWHIQWHFLCINYNLKFFFNFTIITKYFFSFFFRPNKCLNELCAMNLQNS